VFSDSARRAFYSRNRGKLISEAGSELVSLRLGPFQPKYYYPMKKKSAFHSVQPNLREGGFFKLRLLSGVLLCFAGATILLFALGKASAQPRTPAIQTNTPWNGFAAANK